MSTLRAEKTWPEDPTQYMTDYFGNERSPLWDEMEEFKEENERNAADQPGLEAEIVELEAQIEKAKRKTRMIEIWTIADPDKSNAIGMKSIVLKLSGFAKFELDTKLSRDHFCDVMDSLS